MRFVICEEIIIFRFNQILIVLFYCIYLPLFIFFNAYSTLLVEFFQITPKKSIASYSVITC